MISTSPNKTAGPVRVPYALLQSSEPALSAELRAVERVLRSGKHVLGAEGAAFEERFGRLHPTRHTIAVGSGYAALRLVLLALGLGPGDEVVTVSNSFLATAGAIVSVGATPVFCDVDDDEQMSAPDLETCIGNRTRGIIMVHLRGTCGDLAAVRAVAQRHGLFVVEDCAQAVLAARDGVPVGTTTTAGCFSLHPLKNLGACGDAGVVTTNDDQLARSVRLLRNHGLEDRDTCVMWGENSRLDEMQAAILSVRLNDLAARTARRRAHAARYTALLRGTPMRLPVSDERSEHVYHAYVVRLKQRDPVRDLLNEAGIEALVHYPTPIHRQPGYRTLHHRPLGVTERQSGEILSLPVSERLSLEQIGYVATMLTAAVRGTEHA